METVYRPSTRQRLEGAFDFAAIGDSALRVGVAAAMRGRSTVTRTGDVDYTSKYERSGKKRTERERVMMQAVANRVSVYWGFKGLGKAFGYGYYNVQKYRFTDTEVYDACPIFCWDLTSTPNYINGVARGMNPGYRMYINTTLADGDPGKVRWGPLNNQNVFGDNHWLLKGTGNVDNGVNGWNIMSTQGTVNSTNQYPFAKDYISNIDIKLMFFSARSTPSRFEYDVVSLPEDLCPYNQTDAANGDFIDAQCGDMEWHDSYWMNQLTPLVNHPANMQKGVKSGTQHTGFWKNGPFRKLFEEPKSYLDGGAKVIKFDPKNTSVNETGTSQGGRSELRTINLYPERVVDLGYRHTQIFANDRTTDGINNTYGAAGVQDAQTIQEFSSSYMCSPRPEQRMWLIVKGTDYRDIPTVGALIDSPVAGVTAGVHQASYYGGKINDANLAKVDFNDTGSFDCNIIKKVVRNN